MSTLIEPKIEPVSYRIVDNDYWDTILLTRTRREPTECWVIGVWGNRYFSLNTARFMRMQEPPTDPALHMTFPSLSAAIRCYMDNIEIINSLHPHGPEYKPQRIK